jgi:hypothetical protein
MASRILTWFVTYRRIDHAPGDRRDRSSKQFANEQDAKAFAKERLKENPDVTAGTLNPHAPKRFIGSAGIENWLNE